MYQDTNEQSQYFSADLFWLFLCSWVDVWVGAEEDHVDVYLTGLVD